MTLLPASVALFSSFVVFFDSFCILPIYLFFCSFNEITLLPIKRKKKILQLIVLYDFVFVFYFPML